ncbi:MAG: hypothetical protein ABIL74_07645 [candidate division WOR-3 bacterium]
MKLSKDDVELFYRMYHPLLVYVNKKFEMLDGVNSSDDIKKFSIDKINKLRDRLYEHPELIDSFVAENPLHFSSEELKIISCWKNYVKGNFIIFRYLKDYTIFLSVDEKIPKAYGVLALYSTFEEMVGSYLPIMVDTVLLPFNDKIIYDGILSPYSITFGGGLRRSFNDSYQQAKSQFGIITSLPFSGEKLKQTDADKLRFYLRSERNRERYSEEIWKLVKKDKELLTLYHQEMGKIHSRTYRKRLHEIGLMDGLLYLKVQLLQAVQHGMRLNELYKILCHLKKESLFTSFN